MSPFAARRALWLLSFALFLTMTSWFSAAAVLPQLTAAWRLPGAGGAFLTMAVQLGFVAGALISAFLTLADMVGPRRLILVGALGAAVANGAVITCGSLAEALPWRFLTGASLALVYPPFVKLVSSWFKDGRGTALGIMLGGLTLGTAAPHLLKFLGGADWQAVFVAASALTTAGGLLVITLGRDGPYPFKRAPFDPRQAYLVLHHRGVRLAAFGYFGHMWELYAMWAWLPLCILEVMGRSGYDGRAAALATSMVLGGGAAGCWLGGRLGDRWGRTRITSLAMACSGVAALACGLGAAWLPLPAFLAVAAFWGFWVNADSAQFTTIVSEIADQSYVGTAMTLQLALGFLLTNVTLWLTPYLHASLGWGPAFGLLAAGPALGIVAMQRLQRTEFAAGIAGGRG